MKPKIVVNLLVVMMLMIYAGSVGMLGTSTVMAEEKKEKAESTKQVKPSDKKGKYFFKKTCKSCHGKKDDGGEVTPMSKTIKQWERYFKKDKHGEKKLSEEFEAEQLIHVKFFLINHAADSDQPETCG